MGWKRPRLDVEMILSWADDHKARTGKFPHADCGTVPAALGETWQNIDQALRPPTWERSGAEGPAPEKEGKE